MDLENHPWCPTHPSYFWTSKILVCRSSQTTLAVYQRIVKHLVKANQSLPLSLAKDPQIAICPPDPRPASIFQDVPQVSHSVAATLWSAVLICCSASLAQPMEIASELQQFQMGCAHRGIEKCVLLVVELPTRPIPSSAKKYLMEFGNQRGIQVTILTDAPPKSSDCTTSDDFALQNPWSDYVQELRTMVNRQVLARLESDAVELSTADSIKGDAAGRKKVEAGLKMQRSECSLLLKDVNGSFALANAALEIYKASGDVIGTAQCQELISVILYFWLLSNSTGASSEGSPSQSSIMVSMPPAFDAVVKDALALRRNTGSLLQMLGPAAEPQDQLERRNARRSSVAVGINPEFVTAIVTKLREAALSYQKASPAAACLTHFLIASILATEDRVATLDTLTVTLELALKLEGIMGPHFAMLVAWKFKEYDATRKAILAAFLAAQGFVDIGLETTSSAHLACAEDILKCSLVMSSRLEIAPIIRLCINDEGEGVLSSSCKDEDLMQRLGQYIRTAYRFSKDPKDQVNRNLSLQDSRNVYGWPAVQLMLADNLRKIAEYLKQPVAALWLALLGFAAVANAFDGRTQTASQRTLASRESSLSAIDRLAAIQATDGTIRGYKTMPWVVPPSISLISTTSSPASKYLRYCAFGSVGISYRRVPRKINTRYSHFGGLSRGHYVPHLLSLEPKQGRRVGLSQFKSTLVAIEEPKDQAESIRNAFLFQPWKNDDRTGLTKKSSLIGSPESCSAVWAVGDLYSVSVRVRNTLSTDILLDACKLETAGSKCQSQSLTVGLPPAGYDMLFECLVIPKEIGYIHLLGLSYLFSRIQMTQFLFRDTPQLAQYLFEPHCSHRRMTCNHHHKDNSNPQIDKAKSTSMDPLTKPPSRLMSLDGGGRSIASQTSFNESGTGSTELPRPLKTNTMKSMEEMAVELDSINDESTCSECLEDADETCEQCLAELLENQHYSAVHSILVVDELPKLSPNLIIDGFDTDCGALIYEGETISMKLEFTNTSLTQDVDCLQFIIRSNEKVGKDNNDTSPLSTMNKSDQNKLSHGSLSTSIPGLTLVWSDGSTILEDDDTISDLEGIKRGEAKSFAIRFSATMDISTVTINCNKSLSVSLHPFYTGGLDLNDTILVHIAVEHYNQDSPFVLVVEQDDRQIINYEIPVEGKLTKVPLCVPRRWLSSSGGKNVKQNLWSKICRTFRFKWVCGSKHGNAVICNAENSLPPLLRSASIFRRALTEAIPMPDELQSYIQITNDNVSVQLQSNDTYHITNTAKFILALFVKCDTDPYNPLCVTKTAIQVSPAFLKGNCSAATTESGEFMVSGKACEEAHRPITDGENGCLLHQVVVYNLRKGAQPIHLDVATLCEFSSGLSFGHSQIRLVMTNNASE